MCHKRYFLKIANAQQIHINIGFSGQDSKSSDCAEFYKGMNGETCYVGICDRFSQYIDGETFVTKSVPLVWLCSWLLLAEQIPLG